MDKATIEALLADLRRTEARCRSLILHWATFLKSDPYPHRIVEDGERHWRIEYDFSTAVPLAIVLELGRVADGLGQILDDVARAAVAQFYGRTLTRRERSAITYPLRWTRDELERTPLRALVSEPAWAIIVRHQPTVARSLGLLHWRSELERSAQFCPAFPPDFERLRPFYTYASDVKLTHVAHDLAPWSPLEGRTELVRLRFAPTCRDPQLKVRHTPLLHLRCGPLPDGVHYAGTTEMIEDVRSVIADFAALRPIELSAASLAVD